MQRARRCVQKRQVAPTHDQMPFRRRNVDAAATQRLTFARYFNMQRRLRAQPIDKGVRVASRRVRRLQMLKSFCLTHWVSCLPFTRLRLWPLSVAAW